MIPVRSPIIIPDVHGCIDLLDAVLKHYDGHEFIFLGDLIDRGPDSPGVLDRIYELDLDNRLLGICKGNHEDMAFAAVLDGDKEALETWIGNGGDQTLLQYAEDTETTLGSDLRFLKDQMVPWMEVTTPMGRLLLAHASRPSAELMAGGPENPNIWHRHHVWEFQADIKTPLPEGYAASVHGHRIVTLAGYDEGMKAIYLDTGPTAFGNLSVLDTSSGQVRIFSNKETSVEAQATA